MDDEPHGHVRRKAIAVGVAWLAHVLFFLGLFALVVGVPVGLLILLASVLLR